MRTDGRTDGKTLDKLSGCHWNQCNQIWILVRCTHDKINKQTKKKHKHTKISILDLEFNIHGGNSVEFNWNKWHFVSVCVRMTIWMKPLNFFFVFYFMKSWYYLRMSMSNWQLNTWLDYVYIYCGFICILNLPQDSWRRLRTIFDRR